MSTLRRVLPNPRSDSSPCRAHSTDTVTRVHSVSELNTSTSATDGIAASPSVALTIGTPSSTLLAKMPPSANTDCCTPFRPNSHRPISRPRAKTTRQPPKKAISSRASTGGSFEKSLISENSSAGTATAKTNFASASLTAFGQRPDAASR